MLIRLYVKKHPQSAQKTQLKSKTMTVENDKDEDKEQNEETNAENEQTQEVNNDNKQTQEGNNGNKQIQEANNDSHDDDDDDAIHKKPTRLSFHHYLFALKAGSYLLILIWVSP